MYIGLGIVLFVLGAILAFALNIDIPAQPQSLCFQEREKSYPRGLTCQIDPRCIGKSCAAVT